MFLATASVALASEPLLEHVQPAHTHSELRSSTSDSAGSVQVYVWHLGQ